MITSVKEYKRIHLLKENTQVSVKHGVMGGDGDPKINFKIKGKSMENLAPNKIRIGWRVVGGVRIRKILSLGEQGGICWDPYKGSKHVGGNLTINLET